MSAAPSTTPTTGATMSTPALQPFFDSREGGSHHQLLVWGGRIRGQHGSPPPLAALWTDAAVSVTPW
jgi:hypothetical protein